MIELADTLSPEVRALVDELDRELYAIYPEAIANGIVPPDLAKFVPPSGRFAVARDRGTLVGCGALLVLPDRLVEVKRMFVRPEARGKGISRRILTFLEDEGRRCGAERIRLETGSRQPAAIGLYRSSGYTDIAPWPPFETDPLSVCLGKPLLAR